MAAAFDDPRFPPITEKELKDLNIEFSVLTPFKQIDDVNEIEVGKHGIFIEKGFFSGLLLPSPRWLPSTAGIGRSSWSRPVARQDPPHAWKEKDAKIYIFSADIF